MSTKFQVPAGRTTIETGHTAQEVQVFNAVLTGERKRASNAINRLKRAGNETGKTAQKLVDAANAVAELIVKQSESLNLRLPQGYALLDGIDHQHELKVILCVWTAEKKFYYSKNEIQLKSDLHVIPTTTLEGARHLADDVAKGLFDTILNAKESDEK